MKRTPKVRPGKAHRPTQSMFYEKIIPLLLGGMAILTVVFILIALGVLLGLVPYK